MINWQENSWKRTTLLTDRAVQLSTEKAYVLSDSVLCMGRISAIHNSLFPVSPHTMSLQDILCMGKVNQNRLVYEFIPMSRIGSDRRGADGVRVENFPRIHNIADSRRDPEHDD